ncbi:MAG: TonB-dependent receptor [Acidobacteriota bacterium]
MKPAAHSTMSTATPPFTPAWRRWFAVAALLLTLPWASPIPAATGGAIPLEEELRRLEGLGGLSLVYSSSVVTPDLLFDETELSTPRSTDPRTRLGEVLRLFDLEARDTGAGFLVIAPAPSEDPPREDPIVEIKLTSAAGAAQDRSLPCTLTWSGPSPGTSPCSVPGRSRLPLPFGAHHLGVEAGGYLPIKVTFEVSPGMEPISLILEPVPEFLESIEVVPADGSELAAPIRGGQDLSARSRPETMTPTFSDALRGAAKMAGVTSNDGFAQVWMRGGHADQVMVRLDGHEIDEPYVLGGFLSKVSSHIVSDTTILPGAFPVEYGQRLGVIDLTSPDPSPSRRADVTFGLFETRGSLAKGLPRGDLLVGGRMDQLRFTHDLFAVEATPRFSDTFARASRDLGPGSSMRIHLLRSNDDLEELYEPVGIEAYRLGAEGWDGWSTLSTPSKVGWIATRAGWSRQRRDRTAHSRRPRLDYDLVESTRSDRFDLGQLVTTELGDHRLRWGWDYRDDRSAFDVDSRWHLTAPLAQLRTHPATGDLDQTFSVDKQELSLHAGDTVRWRNGLSFRFGLRFDRDLGADRQHWSPRVFVQGALAEGSWHAGWGRYLQSHRPHGLAVLDGERETTEAESLDRWVLGASWAPEGGWGIRVEAYSQRNTRPRPRFVNLFAPHVGVPELLVDRIQWPSTERRSEGLDLSIQKRFRHVPVSTWLAFSLGRTRDRIDDRWVRSGTDQPWTLRAGVRWTSGPWAYGLNVDLREGWPTTRIRSAAEEAAVPEIQNLADGRLPQYERLDFDLSRRWRLTSGSFEASLFVHNLLNHDNVVGYLYPGFRDSGGSLELEQETENWGFRAVLLSGTWSF